MLPKVPKLLNILLAWNNFVSLNPFTTSVVKDIENENEKEEVLDKKGKKEQAQFKCEKCEY